MSHFHFSHTVSAGSQNCHACEVTGSRENRQTAETDVEVIQVLKSSGFDSEIMVINIFKTTIDKWRISEKYNI